MTTPVISQVAICNSALLKIGTDTISSIDESTRAALVCRTLFQYLADEVMSETPWRFATRRKTLAPNATTPAFEFTYAYDIPSDCLRLLRTDDDTVTWVVEDIEGVQQILSNETALNMKYIYRNVDYSSWDPRFAECLAWRLAMELALSLTRSIPTKQEAEKSYNAALSQARSMNAVIGTIPPLEADIWSQARRGNRLWRATAGQTT